MNDPGTISVWGFIGSLGLRELAIVAAVALVLYGRSGVLRRIVRVSRPRPRPTGGAKSWIPTLPSVGDRLFWMLTVVAAAAVATWVVARMLIVQAPH